MALAACGGAPGPRPEADPRLVDSIAAVRLDPGEALASLNAYRTAQGLAPVRLDPALTAMARAQADAMVAANQMSHTVAGSFSARIAAAGLDAREAGENIGAGYHSVGEAMAGWRNSPEHDANLRMADATRFGIAIAKDARTEFGVYWAMVVAADAAGRGGAYLTAR